MSRLVLVADWWWPESVGGAEMSAREAAVALARDHDVTVVVPSLVDKEYADGPLRVVAARRPLARAHHPGSVARRGLEWLSAWTLPAVSTAMRRAIARLDPDVVVVTNTSRTGPWLLRWLKGRRARTVRVYHDLSDTCWRRSRRKRGTNCLSVCATCRVKTAIMRGATPAGTLAVCNSGFVQTEVIAARLTDPASSSIGYPAAVIPVPVGSRRTPAAQRRPDQRHREGRLVLGYIGRIAPVKGIEDAFRVAAVHARRTGEPVTIVVAGSGKPSYVRSLRRLAQRLGVDADFTGHLPVDEFCSTVDVVLIPSNWLEPFGRVAIEMGGRGVPALVSPVGGLPEAAEMSGGPYRFADFGDPPAAAGALAELLANGSAVPPVTPVGAPLADAVAASVTRLLDR